MTIRELGINEWDKVVMFFGEVLPDIDWMEQEFLTEPLTEQLTDSLSTHSNTSHVAVS